MNISALTYKGHLKPWLYPKHNFLIRGVFFISFLNKKQNKFLYQYGDRDWNTAAKNSVYLGPPNAGRDILVNSGCHYKFQGFGICFKH